jgi:hypothetical protein
MTRHPVTGAVERRKLPQGSRWEISGLENLGRCSIFLLQKRQDAGEDREGEHRIECVLHGAGAKKSVGRSSSTAI